VDFMNAIFRHCSFVLAICITVTIGPKATGCAVVEAPGAAESTLHGSTPTATKEWTTQSMFECVESGYGYALGSLPSADTGVGIATGNIKNQIVIIYKNLLFYIINL